MAIEKNDVLILDKLQLNDKLSQAKIAEAVGLTTLSVNECIKNRGMIKGFLALLDHEKMGFPLTACVDMTLGHPRFQKGLVDDLERFARRPGVPLPRGRIRKPSEGEGRRPRHARRLPVPPPPFDQGRGAHAHRDLALLQEISLSSKKESTAEHLRATEGLRT
jgi:DNA-binding Lrp family transcriptional regulator